MVGVMAVHLFEVRALHRTPPLAQLLERIHGDAIADRLRTVGHQEVRVETIAAPRSRGNNTPYWLLDFTKIRFEHGPGKASREDPIESFELDADQGFGEETAVLYDPRRQAMLIQYNHYGARSTIIETTSRSMTMIKTRLGATISISEWTKTQTCVLPKSKPSPKCILRSPRLA
jgi:hypothetical protein